MKLSIQQKMRTKVAEKLQNDLQNAEEPDALRSMVLRFTKEREDMSQQLGLAKQSYKNVVAVREKMDDCSIPVSIKKRDKEYETFTSKFRTFNDKFNNL